MPDTQLLLDTLRDVFGTDDPDELSDLQDHLEWVHLAAGEAVCREGEPGDAMYVVIRGRLVALPADPAEPAFGQILPGETVGDWSLISPGVRNADVVAARSSVLVRLTKEGFGKFSVTHTPFMHRLASSVVERFRRAETRASPATRSPSGVYVVVRFVDDDVSERFTTDLVDALSRLGPVRRVRPVDAGSALGVDASAADTATASAVDRWLDGVEAGSPWVVLDVPAAGDGWCDRCLERADHVVLVAPSGVSPERRAWEAGLYSGDPRLRPKASLVLLHPEGTELPSGTARWLDARDALRHYHARHRHRGDLQRIARSVTGQGIGLVLAGGAALGASHVGVLAALMDSGIPVDFVGGASAGGGIAGVIAKHASYEDVHDILVRSFVQGTPFTKLSPAPVLGFVRRSSVDGTAQQMLGDVDIEDLWLPMFAVSTNLSTGRPHVHRRGSAWKAARATTAVPGLLPPMIERGEVLVDGGVLDNFPVRVMAELCGGPVIGSDLLAPKRGNVGLEYEDLPSDAAALAAVGWRRGGPRLPTIPYVLRRMSTVGSKADHADKVAACKVYVRPSLQGVGQGSFRAFAAIARAGYDETLARLRSVDRAELVAGGERGAATCYVAPDRQRGAARDRFGETAADAQATSWLASDRLFLWTQKVAVRKLASVHRAMEHQRLEPLRAPLERVTPKPGARSVKRLFGVSGSYHDKHLGHCEYGYEDIPTLLLFKLRAATHGYDRPFEDEADWRALHRSLHDGPPRCSLPYHCEDPRCAEWMVTEGYGVLLLRRDGDHLTVDTSEVSPFVRSGDDPLDVQARFVRREGRYRLDRLVHDGVVHTDFEAPDARLKRSLRALVAGMFTIITVRMHMSYCHFEVGDRYATFAVDQIPKDHPFRRMLGFTEFCAMPGSDQAVLTLLDYTFPAFTNLDRPGLLRYVAWGQREFGLLKWFHLPTRLVESGLTQPDAPLDVPDGLPMLQIAVEWWRVLDAYVRDYLALHFPDDRAIDRRTLAWLRRFAAEFGCELPTSGVADFMADVGAAIAFSPIVHRICFNPKCMHPNPFRFGTRLRRGVEGPAALEWRREWMLRASAAGSATLPSTTFTGDLTALGVDEPTRALARRLSDDVRGLGPKIQARWPGHGILLPEDTPCSSRW
jgi:predicted acylesterase/phospholipase RssA/CRP-like cAMP-binding protein